jgi:hypothetical protein
MTNKALLKFFLISLFAAISFASMAQPGNPDPPGDLVPISGIEILLIGGGVLGGIKALRNRKKD